MRLAFLVVANLFVIFASHIYGPIITSEWCDQALLRCRHAIPNFNLSDGTPLDCHDYVVDCHVRPGALLKDTAYVQATEMTPVAVLKEDHLDLTPEQRALAFRFFYKVVTRKRLGSNRCKALKLSPPYCYQ